jgi:hypothetical protein
MSGAVLDLRANVEYYYLAALESLLQFHGGELLDLSPLSEVVAS